MDRSHIKYICILLGLVSLLNSCFDEDEIKKIDPIYLTRIAPYTDTIFTDSNLPINITFIPSSKEKVFVSTHKEEEYGSSYCSATKVNDMWKMWIVTRYKIIDDFNISILQLHSNNEGVSYERLYTNNNHVAIGSGNIIPYNQGASDYSVFYDSELACYKMIFQHIYKENNKTYFPNCIMESIDGVSWSKPVIFDYDFSDTQPGIIQKTGKYYIYMRSRTEGTIRSIAVQAIDSKTHQVVESKRILPKSPFVNFPHLYNNAALKLNDIYTLFLPTIYNGETQECSIVWGYSSNNYDVKWSDQDISSIFVDINKNKWFIISPSLIPAEEPNQYWVYYYTRDAYHDQYMSTSETEYWRLKVRLD